MLSLTIFKNVFLIVRLEIGYIVGQLHFKLLNGATFASQSKDYHP
jgi:hypothetical protein